MKTWEKIPEQIRTQCSQIEYSMTFTEDRIQKIKTRIMPLLENSNQNKKFALVFAGSLGRKEAHETSDEDAFILFQNKVHKKEQSITKELLSSLKSIIKINDIKLRMASAGAFSNVCAFGDLVHNIGGKKETNDILTRRMVLLVEGQGICNGDFFDNSKREILMKYLRDLQPISDRRPIFLINDLLRYYRTICVDYEYKKNEAGKPWAVRLTKLRHSRKMFYLSALLPLLESMNVEPTQRIKWVQEQFIQCTPLERIILLLHKYGKEQHWELLIYYNEFLKFMASKERRQKLDKISFDKRDKNTEYVLMRDNARKFRSIFLNFIFSVKHWQEPINKYVIC